MRIADALRIPSLENALEDEVHTDQGQEQEKREARQISRQRHEQDESSGLVQPAQTD